MKSSKINSISLFIEAKRITSLALPIVVSLSASMLIGVVDTIMIAPLGTYALGAASITSSVLIIFYSALYGLVSMCGVLTAQAHGANETKMISAFIKAAIWVGLLSGTFGCLLMVLSINILPKIGQPEEIIEIIGPYWISMSFLLIPYTIFYALKGIYESIDQAWIGVVFAFVAVGINIPANWILIHGIGEWTGLGLLGAGLASLLSQTLSLGLIILHWRFAGSMKNYRHAFSARFQDMKAIVHNGWPVALGYTGEGGAFALAGLMIGWFGAVSLAANQIVTSIGIVLYMIPLGISAAVSVRIGQSVGAEEFHRVKKIGYVAIGLVSLWMGLVTLSLIILGDEISRSLSNDPEVAALATTLFIIVAAMQIGDGVQATSMGALKGVLDTRWPVLITISIYWLISLPAAYFISTFYDLGAIGVWLGYASGLFIAATILTIRFSRKKI